MTRYLLILFIFFFNQYSAQHLGYKFIENKNQWPSQVRYKADLNSGYLFIENNGFVFNLYDAHSVNKYIKNHHLKENNFHKKELGWHSYTINFRGRNNTCSIDGSHETPEYYNFFLDNFINAFSFFGTKIEIQSLNNNSLYKSLRFGKN